MRQSAFTHQGKLAVYRFGRRANHRGFAERPVRGGEPSSASPDWASCHVLVTPEAQDAIHPSKIWYEIRRIMDRSLANLEEDAQAFGIEPEQRRGHP
jgi:hypothetical protein